VVVVEVVEALSKFQVGGDTGVEPLVEATCVFLAVVLAYSRTAVPTIPHRAPVLAQTSSVSSDMPESFSLTFACCSSPVSLGPRTNLAPSRSLLRYRD